ncbi:membrane integrity-associated transporter subunit PqiC [Stappia sp. F7233]|uniref:Membrane integrity-associated transporter subunit PqiC n=1 Tax=Stappia albiluteola TaxID=2758565 RepID=A0A839AGP8_9HYPH|nr:ABC-type transport auxiliary lipoprotein family protein [Stappia albiluteola]MBA5777719.1 membrane integrity-associated transporter subunit PqiC [Stappia albiluteola]
MRGKSRTAGKRLAVRSAGIARLAAFGLLLSLGACASSGPDALYGLNAPRGFETSGRAGGRQILVPEPSALQALGTNSIAVVDAGPVYTYFPKAAWSDTLPKVVQAKLIETLENTGRLRGVGRPGESLLIDYQLQTELRAFELRIDGQDRAVVEIMARLVNDRNGQTRASRVFRAEVPASGTGVAQAVQAMGAASDRVLAELAAWVVGSV